MKYLNHINGPDDLKKLDITVLPELATEIRQVIVDTVSRTGGHLASSLGVVELTIALHYVFNCPNDKIIWDVGHQSYAHKLITGRRDQFASLRQFGGMSGFIRSLESPFDSFSTGHSSTSISVGLGMTCAKRLINDQSKIIAVIGDGSMTGGLAYESLNQAGDIHKDLIVILNDNEMSISKNVGAISSFLSRNLSVKYLQTMKHDFGEVLKSIPKIGYSLYKLAKRSEDSFKTFITPGMLFEAFNFDYFGPIKGHRLDHLIRILKNIRELEEPVLLHITTTKGKGYLPAEKNPVYFHGVGSFDIQKGKCLKSKDDVPTYTSVFGKTLIDLATNDNRIIAVTAAMPEGTGLTEFAKLFPDRFFDVGIAEAHGVAFAAGIAAEGLKPVVAIYSTFLQRAYDQIVHDVCLDSLNVMFAIDRGGIVGQDGPTHHGLFDLSYLRSIPNMIVMAPKDEAELQHMLFTAIHCSGPVAVRYPRGKGIGVSLPDTLIPYEIGKGELVAEGKDIVIFAIGHSVQEAINARSLLLDENIDVSVVNCRFVKPLDEELILTLSSKAAKIITVEENVLQGGFGSAVLELLADNQLLKQVKRLGIPDTYVEHGPQSVLRSNYGIDAEGIVACVKKLTQTDKA